jgi:hypothetical protein
MREQRLSPSGSLEVVRILASFYGIGVSLRA